MARYLAQYVLFMRKCVRDLHSSNSTLQPVAEIASSTGQVFAIMAETLRDGGFVDKIYSVTESGSIIRMLPEFKDTQFVLSSQSAVNTNSAYLVVYNKSGRYSPLDPATFARYFNSEEESVRDMANNKDIPVVAIYEIKHDNTVVSR